ncbi:hypothetical protein MKW92_023262 [Papaver armeniacum]|nr:hypothetical protein MKW92_023262 [Papaver armeniacum]
MNKHGKPKKLKQQKNKKQRQWKQHNKKQDLDEALVCEISPVLPYVPEEIVCDILSRLPVKSLMRFKCVCKQWQSLIQKDQPLIDLHFSRSKTTRRVSLLRMGELNDIKCMMLMELVISSEEDACVVEVGAMSRWKYPFPNENCAFGITNGLLCVMDLIDYCACVYNISTRQSTPWVKSTFIRIKQEEDKKRQQHRHFNLNMFGLGYDPVTKEHKVIALWRFEGSNKLVCEVLTVGHNTWRRIDAPVPPLSKKCHYFGYKAQSVHVNGFICWLHYNYGCDCEEPCIIQFDVVREKLTKVEKMFPKMFGNISLINIDSRLAMLTVRNTTAKMYILGEQDNESKTVTSSVASSYYWMEETFSETPFDCETRSWIHTHEYIPVPGTDLFMVRCPDDKESFNYYNWKKKSYGSCKIPLGITSSFGYIRDVIFTPSLFPVN